MNPFVIQAPAKINLSLRIVGKRNDGFHEIDTLMVRLPGLCDEIEIGEGGGFSFSCDDPMVPDDETNLVVKAVRIFEKETGKSFRHRVFLRKRIPHGAGLGGGSSDAAAMLRAMRDLTDAVVSEEALREMAGKIGSDVPFFLMDGMVRCTGRGEILASAGVAPVWPVVVVKPAFGVATPDAYRRWGISHELPGIHYAEQRVGEITLVNELERPVFAKHRVLAEIKEWLRARRETKAALLCGSGAAMFAVLDDVASAGVLIDAARAELDPEWWAWAGYTG